MSAKTPYIGSKISLISKAEIRYEGVLYAVDTKEATVTLAKVRSYGTEDRQVQKPIPPRNETYEFIIFRGSDIKDLHVSEFPKTEDDDPAIVSATSQAPVSLPTSDPPALPSSQPLPPPSQPPTYSPFAPTPGGFSPFYFKPQVMIGGGGPGALQRPPLIPPPPTAPQSVHPHPPSSHQPFPPFIPGQLPIPISQKSPFAVPTLPPSTTSAPSISTVMRPGSNAVAESKNQMPVASSTPQTAAGLAAKPQNTEGSNTPAQITPQAASESESPLARMNQVSPPSQVTQAPPPSLLSHITPPLDPTPALAPEQISNVNGSQLPPPSSRGTTDGQGDEKQIPPANSSGKAPLISEPPPLPQQSAHSHPDRRPSSNVSSGQRAERGRGRGRRNYRVGRGGSSSNQQEATYRYENDFDFESANAQFNKQVLEEEFKKLRVSKSRASEDGGTMDEQQETVEDGREEEEVEEGEVFEMAEPGEFYDKSKSFFDSISCETRGGTGPRRTNWNEERELNTETFGVSSVNHLHRGRGRGRWRGRGRGRRGWSRGRGYGRGWRGGRRDEERDRESRDDRPTRGGRRGGSGYYQRSSGGYRGRGKQGQGRERGGNPTVEQSQGQTMASGEQK